MAWKAVEDDGVEGYLLEEEEGGSERGRMKERKESEKNFQPKQHLNTRQKH